MRTIKQAMIAGLAALMLAGALSAASGVVTSVNTTKAVVIGEGAAPIPLTLPPCDGRE